MLRQNGYQRESAVAGCADSALAVGELVPEYLDAVKPVLCFVRDEPVEGWARDVMLCSTGNLVEMLASRPRLLSDDQAADIAARLRVRVTRAMTRHAAASSTRQVRQRVAKRQPSQLAPPDSGIRRKRMPRFFVGLGIWFCFMVVIGASMGAFPAYSDRVLTPAAVVAGAVSWLTARRIIR